MAGLIKTFLETAGHAKFRPSLYHTTLFRYHVLGDHSMSNPGFPPFYSEEFFDMIRKVHHDSPLNVFKMSEKEWYTLLLEENCTMEVVGDSEEYIKCSVERANPSTDWENSWRLARLPELGPDNTSFLFSLLHQILPTKERVARTKPNASSQCKGFSYNILEQICTPKTSFSLSKIHPAENFISGGKELCEPWMTVYRQSYNIPSTRNTKH